MGAARADGWGTAGVTGGGGDACLTGEAGWEKKSEALLRRRLRPGMTSPLKSNCAYRGWGPLCLEDWRGGGGTWPFEVEGWGDGGKAAGGGDLLSEVNELGGRGERGEAEPAGFLTGGGVLSSPPIA